MKTWLKRVAGKEGEKHTGQATGAEFSPTAPSGQGRGSPQGTRRLSSWAHLKPQLLEGGAQEKARHREEKKSPKIT